MIVYKQRPADSYKVTTNNTPRMKGSIILICLSACLSASLGDQGHGFYALRDSEVRPLANFAVHQLGPEYSLEHIVHRHAQLVQGLLYSLTLNVKKASNGVEQQLACYVQIHYVPWQHTRKLLEHSCRPRAGHDTHLAPNNVPSGHPNAPAEHPNVPYGSYSSSHKRRLMRRLHGGHRH